jgi:hypothetical protein
MYVIVAVDDMIFDRSFCERIMRLPFHRGWDHWAVYERDGKNLIHVADCNSLDEAEELKTALEFAYGLLMAEFA